MRHLHIPIYQKIVQLRCQLVLINNLLIFCVLFLSKDSVLKITTKFCVPFFMFSKIIACVLVFPCTLLYTLSCDIESNPGPMQRILLNLSLESQSAHLYSKLFLQTSYIILHKFDICLSETYFDFLILPSMTNYKFLL